MDLACIDDHREHVTVNTDKAVHVIPLSVFRDIADRKMSITELDYFEDIVAVILQDWLEDN